jgi:hypothetical protein
VTVGRRAHQRLSRARRRVVLRDPRGTGANTVAHLLAPNDVEFEPGDPWGWALTQLGLSRDAIWIERSRPGWDQLLDQLVAAQVLEETPPDAVGRGGGRGPVWEAPIADGAPPRPLELVAVWRPHPVLGFDLGYRIVADGFVALWFLPRSKGRGALEALRRHLRHVEVRAFDHLRGAAWTLGANHRRRLLLAPARQRRDVSHLPPKLRAELEQALIRPVHLSHTASAALRGEHRVRIVHPMGDIGPSAIAAALVPVAPVMMDTRASGHWSSFDGGLERLRPCYLLVSDATSTTARLLL